MKMRMMMERGERSRKERAGESGGDSECPNNALRGEWNGEIEFVMKRESSMEISCLFGVSDERDEVIFPL